MAQAYSVQQIKFEILCYIKEFGGTFKDWNVETCADPEQFLRQQRDAGREAEYWMLKPALTNRAALTVRDYFRDILASGGETDRVIHEDFRYVLAYRHRETGR